ncbi:hypothetical protein QQF64_031156, partial [Cirrhinus molitorella]
SALHKMASRDETQKKKSSVFGQMIYEHCCNSTFRLCIFLQLNLANIDNTEQQ